MKQWNPGHTEEAKLILSFPLVQTFLSSTPTAGDSVSVATSSPHPCFCHLVQQVPTITKQSKEQVAFPFDEYFQIECEAKGNPEPRWVAPHPRLLGMKPPFLPLPGSRQPPPLCNLTWGRGGGGKNALFPRDTNPVLENPTLVTSSSPTAQPLTPSHWGLSFSTGIWDQSTAACQMSSMMVHSTCFLPEIKHPGFVVSVHWCINAFGHGIIFPGH